MARRHSPLLPRPYLLVVSSPVHLSCSRFARSIRSNFSILPSVLLVPIHSINVSLNFRCCLEMPRGEALRIPKLWEKRTKKFFSTHRSRRGASCLACSLNCGGDRKLIAPDKLINAFGRNYVRCNSASC